MSQIRDIPDYFLERYKDEFGRWAATLATGEFKCTRWFAFNDGDLAPDSPCIEQGKQMLGAWLLARISRKGVEIEALTTADREAILKHCARMNAGRVPAWAKLREPERPGIPVIPFGKSKGNGHAADSQGQED
jgi:hypothetical protein